MKIIASGPITSWQIDGETVETFSDFSGAPNSLQMLIAAMKLKEESEKVGLELNIQKMKIIASGPISS